MKKHGVSPVIATVLLIAIVINLAVIVFLWARGFVEEKAEKFDRAVELSCPDVNFESGIFSDNSGYNLDIINRGNVPIYGFKISRESDQGGTVEIVTEVLDATITSGQSASINLGSSAISGGDKLIILPIILGQVETGKVAFTCGDEFAAEITA